MCEKTATQTETKASEHLHIHKENRTHEAVVKKEGRKGKCMRKSVRGNKERER